MTLIQLQYVLALDRHRHFRLAAEASHVTQPSLSMQIQKLEEELGGLLFDRNARPVTPTALGRQVIQQARIVVAEAERLRRIGQEVTGELSGALRIGILSTVSPYLLPRVIAPFSSRYPKVALIIEEMHAGRIVERIRGDLLDVGVTATPPPERGIEEVRLFREPLVGYVAPTHRLYGKARIRPEDLHRDDVWLMSHGHCFRDLALPLLQKEALPPTALRAVQFESGNLETLQRLVDRGYGMTLLPWLAVQGEGSHAPESVRPFHDPVPTRTLRLIYADFLVKKLLVQAFAEVVRAAVRPVIPPEYMEVPGA